MTSMTPDRDHRSRSDRTFSVDSTGQREAPAAAFFDERRHLVMGASPRHINTNRPRRRIGASSNSSAGSGYAGAPPARMNSATQEEDDASSYHSSRSSRRRGSPPSLFGFGAALRHNPSSENGPNPPLPSLRVIFQELSLVCTLYFRHIVRSLRRPCRRIGRMTLYIGARALVLALLLALWLIFSFYRDATRTCTPPAGYDPSDAKPLVEYYVHGRGIGHYARSVAIVDQLNQAGVDVRLFLSRAAMWRAMHEDTQLISHATEQRGSTTAISITSLTPTMDIFASISHMIERIMDDCEVSVQHQRYPTLVISDGDMPGMIRAKLGGISSVGIAHGQLFHIAQKPSWISQNHQLNRAWDRQSYLNFASSFFSEWQIATHFCFLESALSSGTVAQAPMRPEVHKMAKARHLAQRTGEFTSVLPREEKVKQLLLTNTTGSYLTRRKRRHVVICYFRDHNGAAVINALLHTGFDVLLFDNGYFQDMLHDPNRYGAKWIIHDHDKERHARGIDEIEEEQARRAARANTGGGDLFNRIQFKKQTITNNRHAHRRLMEEDSDSGVAGQYDLLDRGSTDSEGAGHHGHDESSPRLIRVIDRSMFVPLMYVADGVASSAGSQLMSECIYSDMPLLAHFLESDDEQRLNVELSRHTDSHCLKPHVFGNSFESLRVSSSLLRGGNATTSSSPSKFNKWSPAWDEYDHFVRAVRSSRTSESFYRHYEVEHGISIHTHVNLTAAGGGSNAANPGSDSDELPNGLPEASDILLEIIKQVSNGNR